MSAEAPHYPTHNLRQRVRLCLAATALGLGSLGMGVASAQSESRPDVAQTASFAGPLNQAATANPSARAERIHAPFNAVVDAPDGSACIPEFATVMQQYGGPLVFFH
jgi:hypothetical protein